MTALNRENVVTETERVRLKRRLTAILLADVGGYIAKQPTDWRVGRLRDKYSADKEGAYPLSAFSLKHGPRRL